MGLLGKSALMMWFDLASEHLPELGAWHSREHLPERMALPGFLRGRRCLSNERPTTHAFILYELEALAVMASPAYLDRLNTPTPWSEKINGMVTSFNRTPAQIVASWGTGVGTAITTMRFRRSREDGGEVSFRTATQLTADLEKNNAIVAAHFLAADAGSVIPTREFDLRGGIDKVADLVIIVESFDAEALRQACANMIDQLAKTDKLIKADNFITAHVA